MRAGVTTALPMQECHCCCSATLLAGAEKQVVFERSELLKEKKKERLTWQKITQCSSSFDYISRVEFAAAQSMNAEDAAPSTAAHVKKPPREGLTIDTAAAAADLVGIMSEPPVQTPEKVAEDDGDPSVRGGDAGHPSQPGLYLGIILFVYM